MIIKASERKNPLYSKLSGSRRIRATDTDPLEPARCRSVKSKNENFSPSIRKNGRRIHSATALANISIPNARTMNVKSMSVKFV
jgi:hypothetical protein